MTEISVSDITGIAKLAKVAKEWHVFVAGPKKAREFLAMLKEEGLIGKGKLSFKLGDFELNFDNSNTALKALDRDQTKEFIESSVRSNIEEVLKQKLNISQVAAYAFDDFKEEELVSAEAIDDDWAARFYEYGKNVNSEYLQMLWGKILANEVRRPGTFSLRALDLLRNITKKDAEIFSKLSNFVVSDTEKKMHFAFNNVEFLSNNGITADALRYFQELGLCTNNYGEAPSIFYEKKLSGFIYENKIIFWDGSLQKPKFSAHLSFIIFTELGKEVLSLTQSIIDSEYIANFSKALKNFRSDIEFFIADIISVKENGDAEIGAKVAL